MICVSIQNKNATEITALLQEVQMAEIRLDSCTLSDEDVRSMADESGVATATCHFCNKRYVFTKDDLERIIREKNQK